MPVKVGLLLVVAVFLILMLRACGVNHQAAGTTGTQVASLGTAPTSRDMRAIAALKADLERANADLKQKIEEKNSGSVPSAADLSAAQQKAVIEASYGQQPWGKSATPPQAPEKAKLADSTLWVSYRTEETTKAAVPASAPPQAESAGSEDAAPDKPVPADGSPEVGVKLAAAVGPKFRIRQGTLLPCTEMLRINGAMAGHINCLISFPIFSTSGNHLLIPSGTMALGKVEKVGTQGQERLYVSFESFIMPDGFTLRMKDAADGLDQIGQTGLRDKVNHHYGQIFGAGIALALVGGLSEIGNTVGSYSAASQYRVGVTESTSQSAMQVLQKFSNVLPTFVIREGARNNLYLPGDLYLEEYATHTMAREM